MFQPMIKNSSERLLDTYGVYLEAKLGAHPPTAALFAIFEKAQQVLAAANDRERKAMRAVHLALATRDDADFMMDRLLSKIELAVLSDVERDRTHPVFVRLFPVPVSAYSELSPVRTLETVLKLETELAASTDLPSVQVWVPALAAERATLDSAIAAWQKAKLAHTETRTAELIERQSWLNAYNEIHADLVKQFPNDRKKVENFFRRGPRPKQAKEGSSPSEAVTPTV